MKILHSADWHLDSPMQGKPKALRRALLKLPGRIAALCREEHCDMMLLSGDLFDGPYSAPSVNALRAALEEVKVPVFISPGNHDFLGENSPWLRERWPKNVHIFTKPAMEAVEVPSLGCRVYGAGFTAMDCPGLLEGFRAEGTAIGVLHGDPTQLNSPYCPISQAQVRASGLAYLALGHIHKGGSFRAGDTLCAWPGCPMGRGYDEQGEKGVLIVTIENGVSTRFVPLDVPQFYELETPAGDDPAAAVEALLPPVGNKHFYRLTLNGTCKPFDLNRLQAQFAHFPNLELRDETVRPIDLWAGAGEDSFEGTYFQILKENLESADADARRQILLAAKISRQILAGQEVELP